MLIQEGMKAFRDLVQFLDDFFIYAVETRFFEDCVRRIGTESFVEKHFSRALVLEEIVAEEYSKTKKLYLIHKIN